MNSQLTSKQVRNYGNDWYKRLLRILSGTPTPELQPLAIKLQTNLGLCQQAFERLYYNSPDLKSKKKHAADFQLARTHLQSANNAIHISNMLFRQAKLPLVESSNLLNIAVAKKVRDHINLHHGSDTAYRKCITAMFDFAKEYNITMTKIAVKRLREWHIELHKAHKVLVNTQKRIKKQEAALEKVKPYSRQEALGKLTLLRRTFVEQANYYNMELAHLKQENANAQLALQTSGMKESSIRSIRNLIRKCDVVGNHIKKMAPVELAQPVYPQPHVGAYVQQRNIVNYHPVQNHPVAHIPAQQSDTRYQAIPIQAVRRAPAANQYQQLQLKPNPNRSPVANDVDEFNAQMANERRYNKSPRNNDEDDKPKF